MREYETVFITQPNLNDSQLAKINDRIRSVIEGHGGRLFFARNMGKRNLSYSIKKQTKGTYTCLDYAAQGAVVRDLERGMRLDEDVLRFLTVVKEESVDVEARTAEVVARAEDAARATSEPAGPPAVGSVESKGDSNKEKAGE